MQEYEKCGEFSGSDLTCPGLIALRLVAAGF
jgi:hypothetical protein